MQESFQIEEIRITGPFAFTQIEDISIWEKVNEHGRMAISGIMKEEAAKEWQGRPLKEEVISIGDRREQRPLFTGLIESVSLSETGRLYHVTVTCISFTSLWDRQELNGSFQDTAMRYIDVLQAAGKLGGVKGAIIATADRSGERIGKPVFLYRETAWNFIKRMAGRLQTIVIPEVTYGFPQLCVGCVKRKKYEAEDAMEYQELLDLDSLRKRRGPKGKWQFMKYRIKSGRNYELGDKVQFKGKELVVMQKELKLQQGSLEGSYVLGYEEGFSLSENPNLRLKGVSLEGTVIDTKEGMVKLHLDIDKEQEKERACWFRYTPVTGDIMYSVPECGARAFLNIMDEEENASVGGCVGRHSEVLPEPEVKTLWVGSKKYIAAPEYMGFASEQKESLDALFLDDEWGVVIHTGKKLKIDSEARVVFHARGNVILDSTVRTILKHPNGEGEQAYIEMDCANMRFGGKEMIQSGGETIGRSGADHYVEELSEQENARIAMNIIPMAMSETGVDFDSYVLASASTEVGSTEGQPDGSGKTEELVVACGGQSVESEDDGEIKAKIYIKGVEYSGVVKDGTTQVDNLEDFLMKEFGMDQKSASNYYGWNLETIVRTVGMDDLYSSWEQSEKLRIIICNTDAQKAHLKIKRSGAELVIRLYISLDYLSYNENGGIGSWNPEIEGGKLKSTDLIDDGSTVPVVYERGAKLWEGTYQNQTSEDTGIVYDDFGVDGLVKVKVVVIHEADYRAENGVPDKINLIEGEGTNDYQKFFYALLINNTKKMFKDTFGHILSRAGYYVQEARVNRSFANRKPESSYRKGAMIVVYRHYWERKKRMFSDEYKDYKTKKSVTRFLQTIAHETGHILGLGDAYDRSNEVDDDKEKQKRLKAMIGAKKTNEVPENDMMRNNEIVTSNDVEMVLEAWKSTKVQEFYDAALINYVKSPVIRQDKKDKEGFVKWLDDTF